MTNEQKLARLIEMVKELDAQWPSDTPPAKTTPIGLDSKGAAGSALTFIELKKAGVHTILSVIGSAASYKATTFLTKNDHKNYTKKANVKKAQINKKLKIIYSQIAQLKRIMQNENLAQQQAKAQYQAEAEHRALTQRLYRHSEEQRALFIELEEIFPISEMKRNVYVTGKTGSGKTELLKSIFYKLQFESQEKQDVSLIFLDPHGDIAEELKAIHLNIAAERLLYIDPYMSKGMTPVLNPMDIAEKDAYSVDIHSQQIIKVFKELLQDVKLSNQMEALLKPCLFTLLLQENPDLADLQRFMIDGENVDLIQLGMDSPIKSHRIFFEKQFHDPNFEKTKSSIAVKILSLLNTPTFSNLVTGNSTIDLEAAMDEGKVIIFNLSKGKMGEDASNAFGRFVIANLQSIAQRRIHQKKTERKPAFVFIDECQNYLTDSIETILTETRKFGLHLVLANQYIQQLDTNTQQAVLSSTAIKIAGTNNQDNFRKLAPNMHLKTLDLLALEQYHFYVKSGDNSPIIYPSSDLLIKDQEYLLNKNELALLDNYLIQQSGVYQPIATDL